MFLNSNAVRKVNYKKIKKFQFGPRHFDVQMSVTGEGTCFPSTAWKEIANKRR